jgi:hypothetical protein
MAFRLGSLLLLDATERAQLAHLAGLLEQGSIGADYRPGWVSLLREWENAPRLPAQEPAPEYVYHRRPPGKDFVAVVSRAELVLTIGETLVGLLETAARADANGNAHHGRIPDGETFVSYKVRCQ